MSSKSILKLDWCSHEAAKYAVMNWHYSKTMPVGKLVKIGVWENDKFVGAVIFGRGASPSLFKQFELKQTEGCELVRVALNNHKTPVSRIIRVAIKLLKKTSPGLKLIVSFADTNQGHHGGIYQAGNWIYCGKSKDKEHFRDKNGRVWHSRQVKESGYVKQFGVYRKCIKKSECESVHLEGKHRYLMPLKEDMRSKIQALSQPYPKRDSDDALEA